MVPSEVERSSLILQNSICTFIQYYITLNFKKVMYKRPDGNLTFNSRLSISPIG